VRRWLALALAVAVGCHAWKPALDPKEHMRGEHARLVQEPFASLWPAVLRGLEEEGLSIAASDRAQGTIATRPLRYAGADATRRLAEIADLSRARGEGMGRVSELELTYYLLLAPAGDAGTSVKIRCAIDAIDRSESIFLGPGVLQVVPRHVEVPSRGVVEHDLMRRLVANLFMAEEMLLMLGELGVD